MEAKPPQLPPLLSLLHRLAEQNAAAISQDHVSPAQSVNSRSLKGPGLFLACGEFLEVHGEMKKLGHGYRSVIPATEET